MNCEQLGKFGATNIPRKAGNKLAAGPFSSGVSARKEARRFLMMFFDLQIGLSNSP
jgi:hypothetical protein